MTQRVEIVDTLMGSPDGPYRFIPALGFEVATYVDPREDLIPKEARGFKRLDYHIPPAMRGHFKPEWLEKSFFLQYGKQYRIDHEGYALCRGQTKAGNECPKTAVNRSPFCPNHGGALHPADKKLSVKNASIGKIDAERIEDLDRVQKFLAGFLTVEDLDDDEIAGGFVRNNDGRPIQTRTMPNTVQRGLVKELIARVNKFMQMKLPNMVKVLTDIAESDFAEPADRIKAAVWIAERQLGKNPEVIIHGQIEKPFETVLDRIMGGSRDEFRKSIESKRVDQDAPLDVSVVEDEKDLEPNVAGSNGHDPNPIRVRNVDRSGQDVAEVPHDSGNVEDNDTGTADVASNHTAPEDIKAARERIKKAKARRYAARSQGVKQGEDIAWLIEWHWLKSSRQFKCKLWAPEQQTEARVAKIRDQNSMTDIVSAAQGA